MRSFFRYRTRSFLYAFRGWWHVIRTQQNAWLHALASTAVLALGLWLELPSGDWAVLLLTIAMVWAAEFFNTALEAVVDLASPAKHPLAEVGKDVGAAAVLIAALAAVAVGFLVLGPPLWEKGSNILGIDGPFARSEEVAFKGMELYSWQNGAGEWQYTLLPGTNRSKTLKEVHADPLNLEAVKQAIGQMAAGESLFWMHMVFDEQSSQMVSLPYPEENGSRLLQDYARQYQVDLYIP